MVQRLARGPFKAEIRVRFPLALPNKDPHFENQSRLETPTISTAVCLHRTMKPSDRTMLRLIALFKFVKVLLLVSVGVGAFKLLHKNMAIEAEHWIDMLGLNPGNHYVDKVLEKAANLTPHKIKLLGVGSFIYAGLFLTEGTGLWLAKRWGEWVTVIITSSLVPVEIYEIHRHPNAIKISVLIINVAIVTYLIYRIRTEPAKQTAS
jgi:uncharacterized membrane protein (DUF2068 family)